jgi:cytosine/adenosine deaminase-related metal-dependent hydrolase
MRTAVIGSASLALVVLFVLDQLSPAPLPIPARSDVVIAGVTVINPGVERLPDHSIVIRQGRIVEVRPRRTGDPEPLCAGCFAIPGLIDAHVHNPPRVALGNQELFALLYLAHGVTTVRDVGASDGSIARLAKRLNDGHLVGPRMFRCGPVLDGDPPGWPMATIVDNAPEAAAIVDELADDGVDCIKVYNEIKPDAFEAIAAAAKRRGVPVIGHVPHAVGLDRVSDFEAQHMTGVPYLSRPRPPTGWDIRDEDVILLRDDEPTRSVFRRRRPQGGYLTTGPRRGILSPGIRRPQRRSSGDWRRICRFETWCAAPTSVASTFWPVRTRSCLGWSRANRCTSRSRNCALPWVAPKRRWRRRRR